VKHYFYPISRAVWTDWMLRELDAPHEQVVIDMAAGEQRSPEYRAINPMGKVPALVDGDAVVTEAAAICAYLADKFADKGFGPSPGSTERARYFRYLFFPGVTLEPLLSVANLGVDITKPLPGAWGDLPRVMATVESMTPEAGWALGDQFTAADVVFGGELAFLIGFKSMDASPRVAAYVERIKARPAYQASHDAFWDAVGS
jgi:glutathione S-transferase